MHAVDLLVGDLDHDVDEQHAVELGEQQARHEVHAFQHHRPALGERTADRRVHAHTHVTALVDEADDGRIARHLFVEGLAGLEARVVDRRHELR